MRHYPRDPFWITTRRPGECAGCSSRIKRGSRAFYYPSTRSLYCDGETCGGSASRQFLSEAHDEEVLAGTGNPYAY